MEKKLLKINNKVVLKIDINGGNFYQWKYRKAVPDIDTLTMNEHDDDIQSN